MNDQRYPDRSLRFLISGSTGLVGSALSALVCAGGHRVTRLRRSPAGQPDPLGARPAFWDPASGVLSAADVAGHDVVFHLAGENIVGGAWTKERKRRIRSSRVRGTALLSRTLASLADRPTALVCASAVGYYGDRGDLAVDEDSDPGSGFLADTCREWEEAADAAREAGIRVVHLRIGIVLTPAGGALARMLPIFKAGLGGRLGNGRQFWSWITLDDLLAIFLHAASEEGLHGPVNAVSPHAVRNADFTRALGRVLGRPAVLPAPAPILRLALGEMADEVLLGGARVVPSRLLESGFDFTHPELEAGLRHVLGARVGDP
jgi:uncharacterized protein (TIGR01777 family)